MKNHERGVLTLSMPVTLVGLGEMFIIRIDSIGKQTYHPETGRSKIAADPVLRSILNRIEHSSVFGFSIAGALLILVGLLDYFTGYEIGFALFYLFPVMLSTWAGGRRAGIVMAAVSAVLWLVADHAGGHPYREQLSPFWNATMRLGIFAVVAQLADWSECGGSRFQRQWPHCR